MHKLEHVWRLYATRTRIKSSREATVQDWENTLDFVSTIATVEDFWSVFNSLKRPSDLHNRAAYFLFKQEILPEWEHPRNERGGAWHLNFANVEKVNDVWLAALLAVVGHQLGELMTHVCGLVMTVKGNKHRLSLWLDDDGVALELGQALKPIVSGHALVYKKHHSEQPRLTL